jgi:hypothetical protein
MAPGPLLKGRETGLADRMTVINLVLFEQPVADQKLYAAFANFDGRNHDHAPGAALAEASCTEGGCRFISHITDCYYDINMGKCLIFRVRIYWSIFERNTVLGPLPTDHGRF